MNRGSVVESAPLREEPLVRFEHVYKIYRTGDSGIADELESRRRIHIRAAHFSRGECSRIKLSRPKT